MKKIQHRVPFLNDKINSSEEGLVYLFYIQVKWSVHFLKAWIFDFDLLPNNCFVGFSIMIKD